MTRAEAYSSGWHEGRRWAERDAANGLDLFDHSIALMRANLESARGWREDSTAHALGTLRGYRDTIARFETGTLTWEMFETAPQGPR